MTDLYITVKANDKQLYSITLNQFESINNYLVKFKELINKIEDMRFSLYLKI